MLIPALYNLARAGLLSQEFAVLGVARAQLSDDDFRKRVYEDIKAYCGECVDDELWGWFSQRFYYIAGDFNDKALYSKLKDSLTKIDQDHSTHQNFFYYMAVAPNFFGPIVQNLSDTGSDGPEQQSLAPRGDRKTFWPRSGIGQGAEPATVESR